MRTYLVTCATPILHFSAGTPLGDLKRLLARAGRMSDRDYTETGKLIDEYAGRGKAREVEQLLSASLHRLRGQHDDGPAAQEDTLFLCRQLFGLRYKRNAKDYEGLGTPLKNAILVLQKRWKEHKLQNDGDTLAGLYILVAECCLGTQPPKPETAVRYLDRYVGLLKSKSFKFVSSPFSPERSEGHAAFAKFSDLVYQFLSHEPDKNRALEAFGTYLNHAQQPKARYQFPPNLLAQFYLRSVFIISRYPKSDQLERIMTPLLDQCEKMCEKTLSIYQGVDRKKKLVFTAGDRKNQAQLLLTLALVYQMQEKTTEARATFRNVQRMVEAGQYKPVSDTEKLLFESLAILYRSKP